MLPKDVQLEEENAVELHDVPKDVQLEEENAVVQLNIERQPVPIRIAACLKNPDADEIAIYNWRPNRREFLEAQRRRKELGGSFKRPGFVNRRHLEHMSVATHRDEAAERLEDQELLRRQQYRLLQTQNWFTSQPDDGDRTMSNKKISKIIPIIFIKPESADVSITLEEREVDESTWKRIGTHSGNFHCDEVLACFMLKQLPEYQNADIVRSRDPKVLATCDIVVDVGGVYDHEAKRYDHHQRSFNLAMKDVKPETIYDIKLSSAGLVFAHYGSAVIASVLGSTKLDEENMKTIWDRVYSTLIQEIDAIDNGISQAEEMRYKIVTNLSSRVANQNCRWNFPSDNETSQFYTAMEIAGRDFIDCINYYTHSWLPAKNGVQNDIMKTVAKEDPIDAQIMTLNTSCPWISHFFEIEKSLGHEGLVKYVLFSDKDSWRIRAVPVDSKSFTSRVPLPESWCGLRDEELSKVVGKDGCVFVHINGFIGGHSSYEGALFMAQEALRLTAKP